MASNLAMGMVVIYGGTLPMLLSMGASNGKKRFKKQLAQALSDKAISIKDSQGEDMTVDQLLDLLNEQYRLDFLGRKFVRNRA
ncbi:MAG: hypothetical protein H8E17_02610 [Deltaproteobacteria bacterium]|nr:hypothetical protein [Deltaproteobacteria bacterium]